MTNTHCYPYPLPALAVDVVAVTDEPRPRLLLVERGRPPFAGRWALPGGFVDVGVGYRPDGPQGEPLAAAAARELEEETGLVPERDGFTLAPVATFGDPGRDPRGRVVSVVHRATIPSRAIPRTRAGDDAARTRWFPLDALPPLAFDHDRILDQVLGLTTRS